MQRNKAQERFRKSVENWSKFLNERFRGISARVVVVKLPNPKNTPELADDSDTLFRFYRAEGFRPVKCKGYNPRYDNPKYTAEERYKVAKEALNKGYTKDDYSGPDNDEIEQWLQTKGWLGWIIPKGYVALDVEDAASIKYLETICRNKAIEPAIHCSKNGRHFLFKSSENLSAATVPTKAGFGVTYRVGGKSYLILAPIENRSWQLKMPLNKLPELPEEFYKYDSKKRDDVLKVLSWEIGHQWRDDKLLHGWDDLDTSYTSLLIESGLTEEQIHDAFSLVFREEYDEERTRYVYEDNKKRRDAGEALRGTGSFIQKIRECKLKNIENLINTLQRLTKKSSSEEGSYFFDGEGFLYKWRIIHNVTVPVRLSNFDACIVQEISEDDGAEVKQSYLVEGSSKDNKFPEIEITRKEFPMMTWLHKWGTKAIIEPGMAVKDCVRHYIQVNSKQVERTTFYTHTGWRNIDGVLAYLTTGGAIGAENVNIKLTGELGKYSLPLEVKDEQKAIRASLSFLDVAKKDITLPLLSLIYLAPLTTLLQPMPNFSVFMHGMTGSYKSTLAVLALAHFGDFKEIAKLSNFEDTANALGKRAFILKDSLMVIDDYHPSTNRYDAQKMESGIQRLIRAAGNRTDRGRLNSDASEKGRYEPRCMLLITGEELVSVQSTLARCLVIETERRDFNLKNLSALQAASDLLPHAMSSYIHWIQERIDTLKEVFAEDFPIKRSESSQRKHHAKLHEQYAFLRFSLTVLLTWMNEKGVITEDEYQKISKEGEEIFSEIIKKQSQRIERENPVAKLW
ncbi:MAG: hypothetical protein L6290_09765 [Thermodesulfovibrionales bacterium]|nr:hypothetical protein [Thermodesulfovibrionales bacterium]